MAYTYITNIRHFIPEDPTAEVPDEVLKHREFFGLIIKAATAGTDVEFVSGLPCRKRINRKPCTGSIEVKRQDLPERYIYWHCDSCEDGGRISDFAGTWYDLSEWKQQVPPEPGEEIVEVTVSRDEYKALISPDINTYDPDSEKIMFSAKATKKGVLLRALEGDMDNFIGFVAADGNHEPNRKRAKLMDSVYSKIQDALDVVMDSKDLSQ